MKVIVFPELVRVPFPFRMPGLKWEKGLSFYMERVDFVFPPRVLEVDGKKITVSFPFSFTTPRKVNI